MNEPTIRLRAPDCVAASCGPVLIMVWVGSDRGGASLRAVHKLSSDLAKEHPNGIAHVNVIEGGGSAGAGISETTRAGLLAILRDRDLPLRSIAVVTAGGGFLSALVRSLLSSASLLARSHATIRFVATAREADAFLRSPAGHGDALQLETGDVLRAVATVQSAAARSAAKI